MLVPKSLDPTARGRKLPVPDERPSDKIASLFPQTNALKDPGKKSNGRGEGHRRSPAAIQAEAAKMVRAARTTSRHRHRFRPNPEQRQLRRLIAPSDEAADVEFNSRIAGAAAAQARL